MFNVYISRPDWFLGIDASLELLATVITLVVAFASYRVYRVTSDKRYAYFTASFGLLTLSFFIRALTDFVLEELIVDVPQASAGFLFFGGYLAHILLALLSYLMLTVITLKIQDKKIIGLLALILIPSLLISGSYFVSFYGLSFVLLGFITLSYWYNYRRVCIGSACLVFLAFLLLTIAQSLFLLDALYPLCYVIGHITQAAGFLTLLLAFIKTLK